MEPVIQTLYTISTALQLPVMVILLLFLGWSALQIGRQVREYVDLRTYRRAMKSAIAALKKGASEPRAVHEATAELRDIRGPAKLLLAAAGSNAGEVVLGKVLDDVHIQLNDRVTRVGIGIRLGPMFGLMGTLIPMGPALTGLASGDINVLTQNLVVAFSTTVLGLLIGGICYVLQMTRKRWYAQDLSDLDFLHDVLIASREDAHAKPHEETQG
ncbi:MAG: MotA/TolQ/ExbB proton channel family protein [Planctomycetes bacterium]|nr:MotA/TolQ/ExbB proton channel family protein [Planctomycetota bacterium]